MEDGVDPNAIIDPPSSILDLIIRDEERSRMED